MIQGTLQERVDNILQQTDNPLTSVVILSFNRKDDLEANINSLYEQTNLPFEVIIWDNGSDQETLDYVKSIDGQTKEDGNGLIKVFYSDTNLGCSGGRRKAVEQAQGNWIYTADNDMTYTPNWLEAIIDRVEQDPKIGGANSKIVFPDGTIQLNGSILILEDNYFASFVELDRGKDVSDYLIGEIDCDLLCGGATLVKREVIDQVEHDPEYLNGFEDYDYSLQIANLGYRLVNCPDSMVTHHYIMLDPEKQAREKSYLKDRWNAKRTWVSMIYFLEKNEMNWVKTSHFYRWIEKDGTKPPLKWGQVGGVKFEYEDLFPGRAFNQLTNEELRTQFDSILAQNAEIRSQLASSHSGNGHLDGVPFSSRDVIEPLAAEIDGAFSWYNLDNLAAHLDWEIGKRLNGRNELSRSDVPYLIRTFRDYVVEADPVKAQSVYQQLADNLSRALT